MGNMTMMRFDFFIGFKPFQDTAILTDRGWHQTGTLIHQFLTKSRINSEDIGCRNRIGEQLADNLIIHSRTGTDMYNFAVRHTVSIFRRSGRGRYQIFISRVTNQHIRKEQSSTFHHRIDLFQIFFIQCILIVGKQMFA